MITREVAAFQNLLFVTKDGFLRKREEVSIIEPEQKSMSMPGVHNIRPAGQMWPAEAFHLDRKARNFLYLPFLLKKTPFEWVKTYTFWPLDEAKKKFLARHGK